MSSDYVLFIHGVNVQEKNPNTPIFADKLFNLMQEQVSPTRTLKKISLYWGDVPDIPLNQLLSNLQASPAWDRLWFRDFRIQQLLPFIGDALAYISRLFGALIVERLHTQAVQGLTGFNSDSDRLHIVTHSWGTVILFDVLFAARWDDEILPASTRQKVQAIRDKIFGLRPNIQEGIRLASLHTMGSPIALFTLITLVGSEEDPSGHDISPGLRQLLQQLKTENIKVPWYNFIHPGDPIAWPLQGVISDLLKGESSIITAEDILTQGSGFLEVAGSLFQSSFVSLVNGGSAHGSYWENNKVAQKIAQAILK